MGSAVDKGCGRGKQDKGKVQKIKERRRSGAKKQHDKTGQRLPGQPPPPSMPNCSQVPSGRTHYSSALSFPPKTGHVHSLKVPPHIPLINYRGEGKWELYNELPGPLQLNQVTEVSIRWVLGEGSGRELGARVREGFCEEGRLWLKREGGVLRLRNPG